MNLIQPDLFSMQEAAEKGERAATALCIYTANARGLDGRSAAYEDWRRLYGNSGCYYQSHGWRPVIPPPGDRPGRCQAWTLTASTRPNDRCPGHGELGYRGACLACDWEGDPRSDENTAAEDACDHAFPGWRELPVVGHKPHDGKQLQTWLASAAKVCPPGWIDGGGPIRTRREPGGTRSHYAHEWRGWDICGGTEDGE